MIALSYSRDSWSPDGAHITASNATNQKGLVFIATVILRESWTTEISLVGHENAVEVAVCLDTAIDPSLADCLRLLRHVTLGSSYGMLQVRRRQRTSAPS
jgi:hypothetical protein